MRATACKREFFNMIFFCNYFVNYNQHNTYAQNQQNPYARQPINLSVPQPRNNNQYFVNYGQHNTYAQNQQNFYGYPSPPQYNLGKPSGSIGGSFKDFFRNLIINLVQLLSQGGGGSFPPPRKLIAAPEGPGGTIPSIPPRKLVIGSEGPGGTYPPPRKLIAAPEGSGTIGTGYFLNQINPPPINNFLNVYQRPAQNRFFFG